MWVFDATPLIYLAKVDRLALVQHLETYGRGVAAAEGITTRGDGISRAETR